MSGSERSLEEQRREFAKRRLIATPIAGALVWAMVGIAGAILPSFQAAMVLFIMTGLTVYLGFFISKFTGENLMDRNRPKNTFDQLFFSSVFASLLCFGIAIPFFMMDHSSLPLSVGILTGLMWAPLSWIIQHWIGVFHALARTLLIVLMWYILPAHRFVAIPAVIVLIYIVSIIVLEKRWRKLESN